MNSLRIVIGNAASLFSSDVVNRGTTFVMYALVARYLGSHEFGQIALAVSLFYMFHVLSVLGLQTFITREVAKQRTQTALFLTNGSAVVMVSSILAMAALFSFVWVMDYAQDTSAIILLLSLGLLPYSLSRICEAVFRAWERMHYITYAYGIAGVVKVLLVFFLLRTGGGLIEVVIVLVATRVGTLAIQLWLMWRHISAPAAKFDPVFAVSMLAKSMPFLGIESVHVFGTSVNTILLSKFAGESAVGLYTAAAQLQLPVALVSQSIVASVFPVMCRVFAGTVDSLKQIAHALVTLLLAVSVPSAVGLFFLSDPTLVRLYGAEEFQLASPALRIMAWGVISPAIASAFGNLLLASHREMANLRIVTINAIASLAMGLLLVSQFGLVGAAISWVFVGLVNVAQHYVEISSLFRISAIGRLLWKPLVASLVMAVFIILAEGYDLFVVILSAGTLYVFTFIGLATISAGGVTALVNRCRYLLSE